MLDNQIRKYAAGFILIIFVLTASFFLFFRKTQVNPVTGKKQHINLTSKQEIALGLECAPDMAARFGGLDVDIEGQKRIKEIGQKMAAVKQVSQSPYQFDFHVLADSQIINTYSFPGGQIFITKGLLKFLKTDNEIAAILSHEIGHVMGRHTTEKLSGFNILEEFSDSTKINIEYNPGQVANYLTDILDLTFSANEESEADALALKYLAASSYKPDVLPDNLKKLNNISGNIDFSNRHPISDSRIENLKRSVIKKVKP